MRKQRKVLLLIIKLNGPIYGDMPFIWSKVNDITF